MSHLRSVWRGPGFVAKCYVGSPLMVEADHNIYWNTRPGIYDPAAAPLGVAFSDAGQLAL